MRSRGSNHRPDSGGSAIWLNPGPSTSLTSLACHVEATSFLFETSVPSIHIAMLAFLVTGPNKGFPIMLHNAEH